MYTKALFPGTFDPLTLGHLDIIRRAAALFDEVVVAIAMSPGKRPLFSLEERVALAQEACAELHNVRIEGFSGLLIDFARQQKASVLVRGIRTMTDFDYENQLAAMYRQLMPELEVVFLPPNTGFNFISSTLVREVALHGGEVAQFVTPTIAQAVKAKQLTP
ncbi:MAG: pantetheine-phosphate adenylyltransferase [Aeromonadaceae bacterium]